MGPGDCCIDDDLRSGRVLRGVSGGTGGWQTGTSACLSLTASTAHLHIAHCTFRARAAGRDQPTAIAFNCRDPRLPQDYLQIACRAHLPSSIAHRMLVRRSRSRCASSDTNVERIEMSLLLPHFESPHPIFAAHESAGTDERTMRVINSNPPA